MMNNMQFSALKRGGVTLEAPYFQTELGVLYQGNCLDLLPKMPEQSIDLVLCDLPYGTTNLAWDKQIPLEPLFSEYKRIIKDHGAIILTAQQPFATDLINAGRKLFRQELIWEKACALGFFNANRCVMKAHENIEIFYKALPVYNPQMETGKPYILKKHAATGIYSAKDVKRLPTQNNGTRYPRSVIKFPVEHKGKHPTSKPQALFEWLIKTYTNEGMTVLDNCIGGGTTAAACEVLNRRWIGMELSEEYCEMSKNRLESKKEVVQLEMEY